LGQATQKKFMYRGTGVVGRTPVRDQHLRIFTGKVMGLWGKLEEKTKNLGALLGLNIDFLPSQGKGDGLGRRAMGVQGGKKAPRQIGGL